MILKCAAEGCLNEAEPDGTPALYMVCRFHRAKMRERLGREKN